VISEDGNVVSVQYVVVLVVLHTSVSYIDRIFGQIAVFWAEPDPSYRCTVQSSSKACKGR
jgi:hypothetical protein